MILDRQKFFDEARQAAFDGLINQSQVDGVNAILDCWDDYDHAADPRFIAYSLGTTFHETARGMQPISEWGLGRGRPYGRGVPPSMQVYYGRGLVQLTWLANYQKADKEIPGNALVDEPDNALKIGVAAKVLVRGMAEGWFTGRKLSDFFVGTRSDWVDARSIVNGKDRAALVAGYSLMFYHAMIA